MFSSRSAVLLAAVLGLVVAAGIPSMETRPPDEIAGAEAVTPPSPAALTPRRGTASRPGVLLVQRMTGLGLRGTAWSRADTDGVWSASLRKTVGGIEVSVRIESTDVDTVESAEIDLEIYSEDYTERAARLVDVFREAIHEVAPDLPDGMLDEPVPWERGTARMERLPDTGSRNVLRFTMTQGVDDA